MRKVTLLDIGNLSRGKSKHRPRNDEILFGGNYPFVQTSDIKNANHILYKFEQTYNELGLKQSKLWNKNTICITIAANIAESAILGIDACFPDSVIGLEVNKEIADVHFVEYMLQNYKRILQYQSYGTSQENINLQTFEKVYFNIPTLSIQKSIAKILYSIDKKIELNNKINSKLESLVKTLYDYWFVQFDFPDEFGRPYKSSGGKMVYSDILKREIPLGWDIELINTRYNFLEGPGITKDKYVSEKGHKFLNIKCINDELGDFEIANASMIDYKYIEQYNHFLMKEKDICISTSGTLGRFGVIRKEHLPILLNTSIIRFRNIVNKISYEYMYAYLRSDLFVAKLNTSASGSIQKNVGPTHLNEYFEVFPPKKIDDEFSNKLKPIINKTLELKSETQKLKELRDFLLPMLMNGQVTIQQ